MKQRVLKEKKIKCPDCDSALRLCRKGLICKQNHLFEKDSDTWCDIEALTTGIPRECCFECDLPTNACKCAEIPSGFMLRTRKLELK